MRTRVWLLSWLGWMGWMVGAMPTLAADDLPFSSQDFDVTELAQSLPDKTLKTLRERPDRFIEAATELILGYGNADAIDLKGIETAIQVQRAYVRSREIRRILLADINNDGDVSRAEVDVLVPPDPLDAVPGYCWPTVRRIRIKTVTSHGLNCAVMLRRRP